MFDKFGRPMCGYCLQPMVRATKFDHDRRDGARVEVFSCQDCEAVEMMPIASRGGGQIAA